MKKLIAALAVATALSPLGAAQAGTISFESSRAMSPTNWTDTLSFGKFDSSLGTLTSIRFELSGIVQGIGNAESLDGAESTVTLSLGSLLELTRPDNTSLVLTNPVFSQVFNFSAYDGVFDFGGTSGSTTGTVSANGANFFISGNANDFALFSALGGGTINLGIRANGNSSGTGAGNLITQFNTSAAATAKVTYIYQDAVIEVPEPASLATMFAGLGLIAALRRRKDKQA